jgi:hypothetical protein
MKLRNFTGTSDAPYDKHRYAIVSQAGERVIFDDYLEMQRIWIMSNDDGRLSHVEVLDRIEKKKPVKGFGG